MTMKKFLVLTVFCLGLSELAFSQKTKDNHVVRAQDERILNQIINSNTQIDLKDYYLSSLTLKYETTSNKGSELRLETSFCGHLSKGQIELLEEAELKKVPVTISNLKMTRYGTPGTPFNSAEVKEISLQDLVINPN
jgi:hypothetical protein